MHATEQFLLAMAPFSLFTQLTYIRLSLLPLFLSSIILLGQAVTQAPQATQLSEIITGKPVSLSIYMASNLQAATQSPQPKQPFGQPVSPAKSVLAKAQLIAES